MTEENNTTLETENTSETYTPETPADISNILEAAIASSAEPTSLERLEQLFPKQHRPTKDKIKQSLLELQSAWTGRGLQLIEVATGWRFQVPAEYAPWLQRLQNKKPPRYSRAMLETLALIIYKQPITRAEIEEVRGVAVSSQMIKNLLDRNWIKIAGHRDVPGKPSLFITTKHFLDDFNVKKLTDLPPIEQATNIDAAAEEMRRTLQQELNLPVNKITIEDEETSPEDVLDTTALVRDDMQEDLITDDVQTADDSDIQDSLAVEDDTAIANDEVEASPAAGEALAKPTENEEDVSI